VTFRIILFCLALPAAVLLAQAPPPGSGSRNIQFARVIDANTIEANINGNRVGIRLVGINVPAGNTACGKVATAILNTFLKAGGRLDEDSAAPFTPNKLRRYYLVTADGRSVAKLLAQAGVAQANGEGKESGDLQVAEIAAKIARVGCLFNNPPGPPPKSTGANATAADDDQVAAVSEPQATKYRAETTFTDAFTQEVVTGGLVNPTGFAFLPDGRILIAQKNGVVLVFKNGALLSTPFIDIHDRVNDYWDHGLLSVQPDPNFVSNGHVYLAYTYENNPSDYGGSKTGRVSRFTAVGDNASPASETVILGSSVGSTCNSFPPGADCIPSENPSHSVGSIRFAPDGTIFYSTGEGASFNVVDPDALRAQDLNSLAGKVLHITTSGEGLPSNPFYTGVATANKSKVWGYGLRNPFRFNLRPNGGPPFIGNVGASTWESVVTGSPGANFGWPCYEGNFQQSGFAPYATCQALYTAGPSVVTFPLVVWNHNGTSAAAIGGSFYTGTLYPAKYQGAYFYGDYGVSPSVIRYITVDASNKLTGGPFEFAANCDGPVSIEMGPDGNLYYAAINTGELRRIRDPNSPPTAVATATPNNGLAPLTVQLSSSGSSDPNKGTLSYNWNFGDGTAASTAANPSHTYTANGNYTATLGVTNSSGRSGSTTVPIVVGHRAPIATITAPASSLTYRVADVINFSGSGSSPDTGPLPASALSWQIIVHHCPGGYCHIHPLTSASGASGSVTAPDHGDQSYLEVKLTVTDTFGLTGTASVSVQPQTVQLTLATVPSGLQVYYSGLPGISPMTVTTVAGSAHTILAPVNQGPGTAYTFVSWSDGGAQQHNITVGTANVTYTANFAAVFAPVYVNSGGFSYTEPTGQKWIEDTNFSSGTSYIVPATIAGTNHQPLYQSTLYNSAGFRYTFTIPNGTYTVTLKFAELYYTAAGQRVFNVLANGAARLPNFDIVAAAGAGLTAVDRQFTVNNTTGQIVLQFDPVVGAPAVNGLAITAGSAVGVTVSPPTASLSASQTQQFNATVTGTTNTAVTWSISPSTAGTISTSGFYTAPASITATQAVTVIATSAASGTTTGTATVTLNPPAGTFSPIYVNSGGAAYTDPSGTVWSADKGFSSGNAYGVGNTIANTTTPALYQDLIWNSSPFQYQFAVPNGTYTVTLKFAELHYTLAGQRVFNVVANGATMLNGFDAVAAAGAAFTAVDRKFSVSVTTGQLTIQFVPVAGEPAVNALSITVGSAVGVTVSPPTASLSASQTQQFTATVTGTTNTAVTWSINPSTAGTISTSGLYTAPASITATQPVSVIATSAADGTITGTATVTLNPPAGTFSPIYVNSGGGAYTDPSGRVWSADKGFSSGNAYSVGNTIANTTTPALYQDLIWNSSPFQYQFAVSNGTHTVTLKFAELYYTANGSRVFNVLINGTTVLTNFDIRAAAGTSYSTVDRSFTVNVTGGQVIIQFVPVTGEPAVNALSIQ
jgi:glucose/arabinose dehydrogenase